MAQFLSEQWSGLKTSDVWVDWEFGGKVKGLTIEGGIVDNRPLLKLL